MKYLLLIGFIGVVWWVLKSRAQRPVQRKPATPEPEMMVVCAHCGVHLPESDSVSGNGKFYCSKAHRHAGKASQQP
jgi:uncharacterized protein